MHDIAMASPHNKGLLMEEGYKSKHDITPDSDSGEFSMSKSDTVTGKVTLIILLQRGRYNCHRVNVYIYI